MNDLRQMIDVDKNKTTIAFNDDLSESMNRG